jgi:hypothetical protein
MGGWYNNIGSYVLVRQSDAHAWSEVWLEGPGWTRIDPTAAVAPSRVDQGAIDSLAHRRHVLDYEWLRNVRNTFDLFQRTWNSWVVAFGSDSQSRLFSIFGWDDIDSFKLVIVMIATILAITAIILMLSPLLLKFRSAQKRDPLLHLWQKFIRKLARAGFVAEASMGPMELAEKAGGQLHHKEGDILSIAELYVLCRYSKGAGNQGKLVALINGFQTRPVPR